MNSKAVYRFLVWGEGGGGAFVMASEVCSLDFLCLFFHGLSSHWMRYGPGQIRLQLFESKSTVIECQFLMIAGVIAE